MLYTDNRKRDNLSIETKQSKEHEQLAHHLHHRLHRYEVVGKVVIESKPHPSFPELILQTAVFKAKNRRNGKGKTCKYKEGTILVWRKV